MHNGRLRRLDSLQFDVATVEGKEVLALPNASGFEDKSLASLASSGILGTGAFAGPHNIFVSSITRITPHEKADTDPAGISFDFDVPATGGGFEIESHGVRAAAEQRGTFWVSAENLDLARIDSQVVDPPFWLGMKEVRSRSSTAWISAKQVG